MDRIRLRKPSGSAMRSVSTRMWKWPDEGSPYCCDSTMLPPSSVMAPLTARTIPERSGQVSFRINSSDME